MFDCALMFYIDGPIPPMELTRVIDWNKQETLTLETLETGEYTPLWQCHVSKDETSEVWRALLELWDVAYPHSELSNDKEVASWLLFLMNLK